MHDLRKDDFLSLLGCESQCFAFVDGKQIVFGANNKIETKISILLHRLGKFCGACVTEYWLWTET